MRQTPQPIRNPRTPLLRREKGFALVVALMLMVMLTLLAVGLLGLSSIEVRKGSREDARARARANARLALDLAIGNLQRMAGPDQRVTARADMRGATDNGRWTGVWRSTIKQGATELPVITWDERESVLTDARSDGGATKDSLFEGWLVSGDKSTSPGSAGETAKLVGKGSVSDKDDQVEAPLVRVDDGEGNVGSYAYWISDESMKASVNPPPLDYTKSGLSFQPRRYGIGVLADLETVDSAKDEDLSKVIDYRQPELLSGGPDSWKKHFHAISARATAVLSDPLRGGLKSDLSAYFETGSVTAKNSLLPAISDTTVMLGGSRRRIQGPRYGSLRSFAKLGENGGDSIKPVAATSTTRADKFSAIPKMSAFTSQPIHPVMVQAEIYTRFCYVRGYLTVHIFPRVVLWNPYNVALDSQTYTVDFNHAVSDDVMIKKSGATGSLVNVMKGDYNTRNTKDNRMSFTLEATTMDPGEALVFSAKPGSNSIAGKATPLALRTSGTNTLSAEVDPTQLTNFYLTLKEFPKSGDSAVTAGSLPVFADHNHGDDGCYPFADMMDWYEGNPDNGLKVSLHLGSASNYTGRMRLPLLQLVDTDNWRREYSGRFNNGRWKTVGMEEVTDYESTSSLEPYARTTYGFRYKWWTERNPSNFAGTASQRFWQAAVTADYNLRAPYCHRSPFDAATDNGEYAHWYMWGPYALDREQGLPYLSPERASHHGTNGFRANPFFGGSSSRPDHVYPLFDIPKKDERIVSLGRFQHAQLTPFLWHPTYAIGGSWVPPNQNARDRSGDPATQMTAAWGSQMPYLPTWMKQDRGRDEVVYDLSYEANHELWDRYFLSGATAAEKADFAKDSASHPLANARLVPASGVIDESRLADFHDAAGEVLLGGVFNINSTETAAWRALLASMRDAEMAKGDGASFARFLEPESGEIDPNDPYDPGVWTGFRSLTDQQITELSEKIVEQVKERGPFISVSDFVNRRLVSASSPDSEYGLQGTLQQAIEEARLNSGLEGGDLDLPATGYGTGSYEVGSNPADWAPQEHLRHSKGAGLPAYLQQGDLLQSLGSFLVARGDTFVVRAYGEARTADGKAVEARAWCEAEIQRLPEYVNASDPAAEPAFTSEGVANSNISEPSRRFGRAFTVISFRWLSPTEV